MFKYTRVMCIVYTHEHRGTYLNIIISGYSKQRLGMTVKNEQHWHVLHRYQNSR